MTIRRTIFSLCSTLLLLGCSGTGTESPYQGTWQGSGQTHTQASDTAICKDIDLKFVVQGMEVQGSMTGPDGNIWLTQGAIEQDSTFRGSFTMGARKLGSFAGTFHLEKNMADGNWRTEDGCSGTFAVSRQ